MSRSGYSDDCKNINLWRGAVDRAIEGKRGQAFLKEMLIALDALPQKRLIKSELINKQGEVCAIGSVGLKRGIDMTKIDVRYAEKVGMHFNIAHAMAAEIEFINDDDFHYNREETPEERFIRIRAWVIENIKIEEKK